MRHLYILFLFALLAGCEHDRSFPESAVPVQIVPSLNHVAPGGTRVIDQTWQSNDVVGVSIDNRTTFKTYKPSGTVPGTNVTLIPVADPLYYPTNDDEVTFTAFCPYKTPVGDVVTYNAFTDQSESALMQAVDLIYHYGAKGRKSTAATPVSMSFQHKFSKVVITATRGANVSEDLENLTMSLTGMPTSTTFDLSTGLPGTASGSGTILPEHYNKGTATTIARAIIAPHTGIANRTITFAVGSLNYSYPIPAGFEFETGKEYTFDFTLTQKAPELSNTTIVAWNSGTIAWDGAGSSLTAPAEVTHYKEASTGNTIVIKTNHTATPGLTYNSLGWLTPGTFTRTKSTSPYEWTLTYNVAANTGADRTGNIEIAVGTMKVVTTVTQKKDAEPGPIVLSSQPPANCYMINDAMGNAAAIPMAQAHAGWTLVKNTLTGDGTDYIGHLNALLASGNWEVVTLWRTWNNSVAPAITGTPVSSAGGYFAILSGLGVVPKGHNCVIALRSTAANSGYPARTIWWSWHLWFTDYAPAPTMGNTRNGQVHTYLSNAFTTGIYKNSVMMDRNLGATGSVSGNNAITPSSAWSATDAGKWYGLMYQWGKKDPFTSTEGNGTLVTDCPALYDAEGIRITDYNYWNTSGNYWGAHYALYGLTVNTTAAKNGDGFPKVAVSSTERLAQTIRVPYVYFYQGLNNSWTNTHYNNLWLNSGDEGKTAFDPCPAGWRVPKGGTVSTDNPWAGLYNGTPSSTAGGSSPPYANFAWTTTVGNSLGYGRLYTGVDKSNSVPSGVTAWYPASGLRWGDSDAGSFTSVGSNGYSWSAAISSNNGHYLSFTSAGVYPAFSTSRASGVPVRCVQE